MPYKLTEFPNSLGHQTQAAAEENSMVFLPLISYGCPAAFFQFMCLQLAPPCPRTGYPKVPCMELCEDGMRECVRIMEEMGLSISIDLDCFLYSPADSGLCFAEDPFAGYPFGGETLIYNSYVSRAVLTSGKSIGIIC